MGGDDREEQERQAAVRAHKERVNLLLQKARRYGLTDSAGDVVSSVDVDNLQRTIWQLERESRDARLWWIALLSALAAILSALAAWAAVLRSSGGG